MKSRFYRFSVALVALVFTAVAAWAGPTAERVLVAIEGGGAVELDARSGALRHRFETGNNAFGALYSRDGRRAFVTDKSAGTFLVLDPATGRIVQQVELGKEPQQPAVTDDGRVFVPMSGEGAIAVLRVDEVLEVHGKVSTGAGTKPHIVSLSPDQKVLYVTIQGIDPRVAAYSVEGTTLTLLREFRDQIVPRVTDATVAGAYFTGHHSTGLHFAELGTGAVRTVHMDRFGDASAPAKQIEGVAATADSKRALYTHEGRKALVALGDSGAGELKPTCEISPLPAKPYWVSLDPSGVVAYVSVPDAGLVQAYDVSACAQAPLWSAQVGGKAKRLAVTR